MYIITPNSQSVTDTTQQIQEVEPMLVYCWPTGYDAGPTLNQHWFNFLCLLGSGIYDPLASSGLHAECEILSMLFFTQKII